MHSIYYVSGKNTDYKKQTFSSTDLSKNEKDIGIVYPIAKTRESNVPSFSCIVEHSPVTGKTLLANVEFRLVNQIDDEKVEYSKANALAYVRERNELVSAARLWLTSDYKKIDASYLLTDDLALADSKKLQQIINEFNQLNYNPTFIINPDNVKKGRVFDEFATSLEDFWPEYEFAIPDTPRKRKRTKKHVNEKPAKIPF